MTTPHLEPWVYNLITAIDDYEDTHPSPDADGKHEWPCFADELAAIPAEQLDRARAIAHYRRKTAEEN
jgi:hypothetical protein